MMSENFQRAFALMDDSGKKSINIEAVFEFCDTLATPPSHDAVRKIYNEFDEDGSGDIDSEEFLGFCQALEKLTGQSTDDMVKTFCTTQFQRLFALIVEGNKTVNRDELKVFLDTNPHILSGLSASDVVGLLKRYDQDLSFDQFCEFIGKIVKGKSIKQCVKEFSEAKESRKKAKASALQKFQKAASNVKTEQGVLTKMAPSMPHKPSTPLDKARSGVFLEAFTMLDSRGGGVLNLDSLYEFCEALPNPPSQGSVRKLYNEFDEDGSGDIDSEEFLGFCQALEKLTEMSAENMLGCYTQAMYNRLFTLADDSGDGNCLVGKDEMKKLLEAISPMLSAKFTPADLHNLVRDMGDDQELNIDQFTEVIKKLTVGKSISQIVAAFEEAKRRRKALKYEAFAKFEGKEKSRVFGEGVGDMDSNRQRLCFDCMDKDEKIKELQSQIDDLHAQLAQAKAGVEVRQVSTIGDGDGGSGGAGRDEMLGNRWEKLHSLHHLHGVGPYKKYPQLVKPALHFTATARVTSLCAFLNQSTKGSGVDTDAVARSINLTAPKIKEAESQIRALMDIIMNEWKRIHELLGAMTSEMEKGQEASDIELSTHMELIQSFRQQMSPRRDDVIWLLDNIVEDRTKCCDWGLCVAPYTTKAQQIMTAISSAEEATQTLLDFCTVVMEYGSDQLTDMEIFAKKIINKSRLGASKDDVASFRVILDASSEKLNAEAWKGLFTRLSTSIAALQRSMSTSASTLRDKGMQTQPQVDALPIGGLRSRKSQMEGDAAEENDPNNPFNKRMDMSPRSSAPRMREMKKAIPKDTCQHVDKLLSRYFQKDSGVEVPPNFQRCEPGGNQFIFGTKRIELIPVDRFVAVIVGGGYLLFDEFCRKYCRAEQRRFVIAEKKQPIQVVRSGTPTPSSRGGHTPRTATPAGASTPRVVVRDGRGIHLA